MSRIEITNLEASILKSRLNLLVETIQLIIKTARKELGEMTADIDVNESGNVFIAEDVRIEFPVRGMIATSISEKRKELTLADIPYAQSDSNPFTSPLSPIGIEGPTIHISSTGRHVQFYYCKLLAGQVEGLITEKDNRIVGYFKSIQDMIEKCQKPFKTKPEPKIPEIKPKKKSTNNSVSFVSK